MKQQLSLTLATFLLLLSFTLNKSFKKSQTEFHRVKAAYDEKGQELSSLLKKATLRSDELRLYMRGFKLENELEIWAKNKTDDRYSLLKTYKVCKASGSLGPKRKQGDLQVPEGYYHINRFNPASNYHLSLGINYPNKSDKILGEKERLGGDIFIHGNCVTIGCLPMTDDKIKEIYILCVEAKNSGQETIPISIFPSKLTDENLSELEEEYRQDREKISLWKDLKKGYDFFEKNKKLPNISFLENGRHLVSE